LRQRDQQGSTHIPSGHSASSTDAFPRKVNGFLTLFAILCARKASSESTLWLHVKSRQWERQHLRHVATQSERRPVNRKLHLRCGSWPPQRRPTRKGPQRLLLSLLR